MSVVVSDLDCVDVRLPSCVVVSAEMSVELSAPSCEVVRPAIWDGVRTARLVVPRESSCDPVRIASCLEREERYLGRAEGADLHRVQRFELGIGEDTDLGHGSKPEICPVDSCAMLVDVSALNCVVEERAELDGTSAPETLVLDSPSTWLDVKPASWVAVEQTDVGGAERIAEPTAHDVRPEIWVAVIAPMLVLVVITPSLAGAQGRELRRRQAGDLDHRRHVGEIGGADRFDPGYSRARWPSSVDGKAAERRRRQTGDLRSNSGP